MLLNYITLNYSAGEPIFLQNIELNMKYDNLCQQIKKLVDEGFLCRYMDGVYYLPKKTLSGIPFVLNSDLVAELKYVSDNNSNYGCYTGHTLANFIGLSDQVPHVKEIVSNKTSAVIRTVKVGNFKYIVRKAPVIITNRNVKTVMLLEVLKDIDKLSDIHINPAECLKKYVSENNIKKEIVDELLPNYPLKTYKAIYDMGLINVFT